MYDMITPQIWRSLYIRSFWPDPSADMYALSRLHTARFVITRMQVASSRFRKRNSATRTGNGRAAKISETRACSGKFMTTSRPHGSKLGVDQ